MFGTKTTKKKLMEAFKDANVKGKSMTGEIAMNIIQSALSSKRSLNTINEKLTEFKSENNLT